MFWGKKKEQEASPPEEDVKDRRHYFRLEKQINIKVFDTQRRQYLFATRDISGGGVCLYGPGGFPPGTYLTVHIQLDETVKPVVAVGRVIWTKRGDTARTFDMGLEFVDIKEHDRDFIVKYINDELLRLRRKGIL